MTDRIESRIDAHIHSIELNMKDLDDEPDEYAGTRPDREASAADDRHQFKAENDNGTSI